MILVTQGHQEGIGLEVFLKSFLCLSKVERSKFVLYVSKTSLEQTLKTIHITYQIKDNAVLFSTADLKCIFFDVSGSSETLTSINLALTNASSSDVILTLPSSKDQFFYQGHDYSGHTEYFRKYYDNQSISMCFLSHDQTFLLLTDHISVSEIEDVLTAHYITGKVSTVIDGVSRVRSITEILFSGINPHCGEDGLMGQSDRNINLALNKLKQLYPNVIFNGPHAGDTLHFKMKSSKQLFVYAHHDQGLGVFKLLNGLTGINLTLGMPILRVSPDHGTAFELYGKNTASYQGCLYLLNEILKW